jgi:hypothetical protein
MVRFDKDMLSLTPIDSDGLRKLLQGGMVDLMMVPEAPKALFAPPVTLISLSKDLKSFCRRFADDKTVFDPGSTFTFKRK